MTQSIILMNMPKRINNIHSQKNLLTDGHRNIVRDMQDQEQGWGDGSVGKVFIPEFGSPEPG